MSQVQFIIKNTKIYEWKAYVQNESNTPLVL